MKITLVFAVMFFTFAGFAQDTTLTQYVGRYVFPEGSVVPDVTVLVENGALSMSSSQGGSPMTKLGVDSFEIPSFSGFAVFRRSTDKKISAIHIEAMGYVLDGTKAVGTGIDGLNDRVTIARRRLYSTIRPQ